MLEKILYDYLKADGVLSVPVYLERPKNPPASFVLLERTGGSGDEKLMQGIFAVQSIAPSLYETVALNEEVIEAVLNADDLDEIGSVRLNDFYNFTHRNKGDRDEHRYQAIFDITYYD